MNSNLKLLIALCVGLVLVGWHSCTKSTIVGSDLLDDEVADLGFTDTLSLEIVTVREDSVLMKSAESPSSLTPALCGQLNDPFFGRSSSEIYTEVFLTGVGTSILENDIDSVVLSMVYDTTGLYGELDQPVSVDVFRMAEPMDLSAAYYSDVEFMTDPTPIGSLDGFVPRPADSLTIIRADDTSEVKPMLRIPLSTEFANELSMVTDTTLLSLDSFQNWLPGINVVMSSGENTMLSFNLNDAQSSITVYYSDVAEDQYGEYSFAFNVQQLQIQVQVAHFEHDYAGSQVEPFIGDPELGDSLVFIQSMSGLNAEITIPGLENLQNKLINQAQLEFFMAMIPENDTAIYPEARQLITRTRDDEGGLVIARDPLQALQAQQLGVFGGNAHVVDTAGDKRIRYLMNVTASVQDIVAGRAENKIYVSSYLKQYQPRRVMLYGPGHPEYPARLRLTFTETP